MAMERERQQNDSLANGQVLPKAFFGGMLIYISLAFLDETLVHTWHTCARLEYGVILVTLVAINVVGVRRNALCSLHFLLCPPSKARARSPGAGRHGDGRDGADRCLLAAVLVGRDGGNPAVLALQRHPRCVTRNSNST